MIIEVLGIVNAQVLQQFYFEAFLRNFVAENAGTRSLSHLHQAVVEDALDDAVRQVAVSGVLVEERLVQRGFEPHPVDLSARVVVSISVVT